MIIMMTMIMMIINDHRYLHKQHHYPQGVISTPIIINIIMMAMITVIIMRHQSSLTQGVEYHWVRLDNPPTQHPNMRPTGGHHVNPHGFAHI